MHSFSITGHDVSADEAAAVIAAISCLLQEEAAAARPPVSAAEPPGWPAAARLITQGLIPSRLPVAPSWGRVERIRRGGRGGSGIVGL